MWENLLVEQPAVTRLILFGALLVVLMIARPRACSGRRGWRSSEWRPLLELRDVSKAFGGLHVIDELELHVDEREIVSVIGPNGAGKTTLFNLITGVYRPDAGDILLDGASVVGLPPHEITRRGVARTFQTLRLFLNMTVKENVMAAAYGAHERGRPPLRAPDPGMRREEREIEQLAEERLSFFGAAADGLPLGPARVLALVREPSAARDRARDRD